ncbi:MAG TPA: hypothetical protein VIN40_11075 [Candidatus Tyrphobacter sp.]
MVRPTLGAFLRRLQWGDYAGVAVLAAVFAASVWPIVHAGSVPALQQDWSWPLSRPLALQWLHGFIGMWDDRSLGQPNLLPWQTYAVLVQVALVLAFGPSHALVVWILALESAAAVAFIAMLRAFGIRSRASAYGAALLYAAGPVFFTRLQAGHLAYLVGYALLPLVVSLAYRLAATPRVPTILALGLVFGIACSQIQFLFIAPLAVGALAVCAPELRCRRRELLIASVIAVALLLQSLLPLAFSAAAGIYENQRALVSWEYNLSAHPGSAAVMLGYFTHYYAAHAVSWISVVLYALAGSAFVVAFASRHRYATFAATLWLLGWIVSSGLYGPMSLPFAWAFEHLPLAGVFRDLNYFAVLTSLGICLAVAIALDAFGALAAAYFPLVAIVVLPMAMGAGLSGFIVSPLWVEDTLADMQAIHDRGPGRALLLPAEEPVGSVNGSHAGRDLAAYAPRGNATIDLGGDDRMLAYALATLREGRPRWQLFWRARVRYLVTRQYLRTSRTADLGIGVLPHADASGAPDEILRRQSRLRRLRRSRYSEVYELPTNGSGSFASATASSAMLFSELEDGEIAVSASSVSLPVPTSVESPDPRLGWIASAIGVPTAPWLSDSIYPFAWTLSSNSVAFELPRGVRCLLVAAPSGANLSLSGRTYAIRGRWRRYTIGNGSGGNARLQPLGLVAVARKPCDPGNAAAASQRFFVMPSRYDRGWRLLTPAGFVAPILADGWMMAWPLEEDRMPAIYLPAIAQAIGLIAGGLILAFTGVASVRRR